MSTPNNATTGDLNMAKITNQADLATACLVTCSVHVDLADGHRFTVPAFPWDVLDVCASLARAGAVSICAWQGRHMGARDGFDGTWFWQKPAGRTKRATPAPPAAARPT